MSGQWIAVDAYFFGSALHGRLFREFGPAGDVAWIGLLCWAKRDSRDGTVKFINSHEALNQMGLAGYDLGATPDEWLERFWKVLASMKQARREQRRSTTRATQKVHITNWAVWQEDRKRETEAAKKRRQRDTNKGDIEGDTGGTGKGRVPGHVPSDSDSDSFNDPPKPPLGGNDENAPLEKRNGNGQSHITAAGAAADLKAATPKPPPIVKRAKR